MGSPFLAIIITALLACHILTLTLLPTCSAEREKRQLPCTHPLRISHPQHFTHCSACQYSSWSSWRKVHNSVVSVPVNQCPSGKAYMEERTRTATGSGCTEALRETQRICLPTQEERLIIALGLGGSGNNYRPLGIQQPPPPGPPPPPPGVPYIRPLSVQLPPPPSSLRCPRYNTNGQICSSLPGIGKRSIKNSKVLTPTNEDVRTDLNPIPFDWLEHGPRLRSRRQTSSCGNQDTQHVLFVLDTSGSIGGAQFRRMKNAISQLPPLFCKQVKFAVITFSSYINLEFCFNCFENTYNGRSEVRAAINRISYRGGGTRTGATARCVCQELLHPRCGIDAFPDCLDVVFITDGKSNDPTLQICSEVRCLHSRLGVDTYAIGINSGSGFTQSYNRTELDCITNYGDLTSAFEFESFTAFERAIESLTTRLLSALPNSPESCARLDGNISPTGSVPFKKK